MGIDNSEEHSSDKQFTLNKWRTPKPTFLADILLIRWKYLARHGQPKLINNINLHGDSGWAGVAAGMWIHFNYL